MKHIQLPKQSGFSILSVILVIVAVIVAVGVWALSGQTNTSNSSSSSADIQAAAIINDGASIKLIFDTLIVNGASPSSIIFRLNFSDPNNILDPITGIQSPKPNANAISANPSIYEGYWTYNSTSFKGYNVGTAAYDITIVLGGIKDSVCERINYNLYGFAEKPTYIGPGGSTSTNLTIGGTAATPTIRTSAGIKDLSISSPSANLNANGWTSGCIGGNAPDTNAYFRILKIN